MTRIAVTIAVIVAAVMLFALVLFAVAASAASRSTLAAREQRQERTLHRHLGTVRFFRRHPRLARTPSGRRALRIAWVWIPVVRRELAQTRREMLVKARAAYSVPQIVCAVFGRDCPTALRVAACESHFSTRAVNGQYFGIFQMGSHERSLFGGSSTDPWDQVRAAYRYFSVSGWRPWECA